MPEELPATKPAWHGTLLAKSDADLWLTEGVAAYERIVALEQTLREGHDDGQLTADDKERLAIELGLRVAPWRRSLSATGADDAGADSLPDLDRERRVRA